MRTVLFLGYFTVNSGKEFTTTRCVMNQNNAALSYFAAE
jgi:hypothetical protein